MAHRLTKIRLNEISFVDRGAAGTKELRPKVLIAKRAEQAPAKKGSPMSFLSKLFAKSAVAKELPDLMSMLDECLAGLSEDQQAQLKPLLVALMQGAPKAAPAPAPKPNDPNQPDVTPGKADAMKPEEMKKFVAEEITKALAEQAKTKDAEVKKALDERDAEIKKLRTDLDAGKIEKRKAEIAKRAGDISHLPGKTDELLKALEEIETKVGSNVTDVLMKRLEGASRLVKHSGVFGGGGRGMGPGADEIEGSVVAKIEKAVSEMIATVQKQDGAKVPTREQAFAKIWTGLSDDERRDYAEETSGRASA